MRALLGGIAVLALGACDSGSVPSPADRMSGDAIVDDTIDPDKIALHSEGLVAGPEAFFFAAGRSEVESAVTAALGEPSDIGTLEGCGAGALDYTTFPKGLTVNFQKGNLVGWYLREASEQIEVDADVSMEMSAQELAEVEGYNAIEDSTLGEEFIISGQVAGFVEEGKVSTIYAGVQCFFR